MAETGLPDLDAITEDGTAAVIIVTLTTDGTLDLSVYEADGISVDVSDVLRCAMSLNDDEASGRLN